jgi:hypothetical protein
MRKLQLLLVVTLALLMPVAAITGPSEEANPVVDRWSAAITSNDPDEVTRTYSPDAILLGTASPVMSEGTGNPESEIVHGRVRPVRGSIHLRGQRNLQIDFINEEYAILVDLENIA